MSVKTKEQLEQEFSDNQVATGAIFKDLFDSLKAVQSAVSDPAASGTSITFIATISQDTEGRITATKKTVNFGGYQTTQAMQSYQINDLQQIGEVNVDGSETAIDTEVVHKMRHYPTVRLMDSASMKELDTRRYTVQHVDTTTVIITLDAELNVGGAEYKYLLD